MEELATAVTGTSGQQLFSLGLAELATSERCRAAAARQHSADKAETAELGKRDAFGLGTGGLLIVF